MAETLTYSPTRTVRPYSRQELARGAMLFGAFLGLMLLVEHLLPVRGLLFLSAPVAVAGLFLGGLRLWPAVYLASLAGHALLGSPTLSLVLLPIAQALQALIGAYLLHALRLDPLFRRTRDAFSLLGVLTLVSAIVPAASLLSRALRDALGETVTAGTPGLLLYVSFLSCNVILVPFLLRWLAKPSFRRRWPETVETLAAFALLVGIAFVIFPLNIGMVAGLPLTYALLIPLFWIGLRMRPRFVTLAMLVVSVIAVASLHAFGLSPGEFNARLLSTEAFLAVFAAIFLIIASLEEDRRLHTNLMLSQMSRLENAMARVTSESKAKNDFIAILAHELRNPLAPVVSGIELLSLGKTLDADARATLTMMDERLAAVRKLLDDLLDISRITEGKATLDAETTDLDSIIRRAMLSTAHTYRERHQALAVTSSPGILLSADPLRLEQVFTNLLSNASKYSPSGTRVTLTAERQGSEAVITVADQGIGISSATLPHVFTAFHQADAAGRGKKGLGIGLALVKSFVEMHGGSVTAESAGVNEGSRFIVRLPALPQSDLPHASATAATAPAAEPSMPSAGLSVLVVDDNDAAAWGIGKLLELSGCRVAYAYDGHQGIAKAEDERFDIIMLDIGLPDLDGYEVARTLRARGYRGRLIALTGFSTENAREKGQAAGFEQYLVKPAGIADLRRAIPELR